MPDKERSTKYTYNNLVKLISSGNDYFSLLERLINGAQNVIHLQTYIFLNDLTGTRIGDALIAACKRGVSVYFIADAYGSRDLPSAYVQHLKENGIHFRFYNTLFKHSKFYFGRRMHHKVVVCDGNVTLIGGINISDRYNSVAGQNTWLDKALLIEGEAAMKVHRICVAFWSRQKLKEIQPVNNKPVISGERKCSVRILQNDWVKAKQQIAKSYFNLFTNARSTITIMCSYFLPGTILRNQLIRAARRGVHVKLVVAGVSDVLLGKHAERYLYGQMLKGNIEIFEYQPSVLHAKICVVDDHFVTVGSYNINNISAFAAVELNAEVRNRQFAREVQDEIDQIIKADCKKIKLLPQDKSFFKSIIEAISFRLVQLLIYLFTFYFKRSIND